VSERSTGKSKESTFDFLIFPSWPIRTLSFSYDGVYLATGSEDSAIDIVRPPCHLLDIKLNAIQAYVETGMEARRVPTTAATNSLAWHPGKHWLAYAGEDKDGSLRILAFQDSQ